MTPAGGSAVSVNALEIGVSGGILFAGVGGPTSPSAMGVSFTGLSVGLVSATTAGPSPTKYFALRARGTGSLVGIDGIDIGGTLEVQMNTATVGNAIDFSAMALGHLSVATGIGTPTVDINLADAVDVQVTGTAHLTIQDFLHVSAGFALKKGGAATDRHARRPHTPQRQHPDHRHQRRARLRRRQRPLLGHEP